MPPRPARPPRHHRHLLLLLVAPLALAACQDEPSVRSRRDLKPIALHAGQPGGTEIPALDIRIDLPEGSTVSGPDADGYITAGTKQLSVRLSVDQYRMTLVNALEPPSMRGTQSKVLEAIEGSDGWYLVTRSTMDLDPRPYSHASVNMDIGDRSLHCSIGSSDHDTALAGLAVCRTMRARPVGAPSPRS